MAALERLGLVPQMGHRSPPVAGLSHQSVTPNLIHDDPGILSEPMRIALTGLSGNRRFPADRLRPCIKVKKSHEGTNKTYGRSSLGDALQAAQRWHTGCSEGHEQSRRLIRSPEVRDQKYGSFDAIPKA